MYLTEENYPKPFKFIISREIHPDQHIFQHRPAFSNNSSSRTIAFLSEKSMSPQKTHTASRKQEKPPTIPLSKYQTTRAKVSTSTVLLAPARSSKTSPRRRRWRSCKCPYICIYIYVYFAAVRAKRRQRDWIRLD